MRARRGTRRKKRIKTALRPSTGGLGERRSLPSGFPTRKASQEKPPPDPGSVTPIT